MAGGFVTFGLGAAAARILLLLGLSRPAATVVPIQLQASYAPVVALQASYDRTWRSIAESDAPIEVANLPAMGTTTRLSCVVAPGSTSGAYNGYGLLFGENNDTGLFVVTASGGFKLSLYAAGSELLLTAVCMAAGHSYLIELESTAGAGSVSVNGTSVGTFTGWPGMAPALVGGDFFESGEAFAGFVSDIVYTAATGREYRVRLSNQGGATIGASHATTIALQGAL